MATIPTDPASLLVDDAFLADIDEIRGIPGELGKRVIGVTMRVVAWSGSSVGEGTATVTDTPLLVGNGTQNVHVTQVNKKDVMASGGVLSENDMKIGPLTPSYLASLDQNFAGGVAASTTDPAVVLTAPSEIYFKLQGPIMVPAAGAWYKRIYDDTTSSTRSFLFLRRDGTQQPGGQP